MTHFPLVKSQQKRHGPQLSLMAQKYSARGPEVLTHSSELLIAAHGPEVLMTQKYSFRVHLHELEVNAIYTYCLKGSWSRGQKGSIHLHELSESTRSRRYTFTSSK